jgi:hypothetical protein
VRWAPVVEPVVPHTDPRRDHHRGLRSDCVPTTRPRPGSCPKLRQRRSNLPHVRDQHQNVLQVAKCRCEVRTRRLDAQDETAARDANATPTHIIELPLTLAIKMPMLGCRQYADRLADQGFEISKSTVQNHLVAHGLGRRRQRLARAAAITALWRPNLS